MSKVFKFGGASVKDANAVRNVAEILKHYSEDDIVVVISAMGKTTNTLEQVLDAYWKRTGKCVEILETFRDFHREIIKDLFDSNSEDILAELDIIFNELSKKCDSGPSENFNFEYAQIVSLGEIISTKIIHAYLNKVEMKSAWLDARTIISTDTKWREARINWGKSEELIRAAVNSQFEQGFKLVISQGFIGHNDEGVTTTLGREGSDFSAAIFAYALEAADVTIWKDVPGMLNADPKWFDNTILLEQISFREAIELAYFGASVIHPRTIQPLKRKNIPLYIKSFVDPDAKGSAIQRSEDQDGNIPSFIFKMDQVLISLSPRDFSFVIEDNLEELFGYLGKEGVRINIMQNSAVSFSFCCDRPKVDIEKLIEHFQDQYVVKYNENLELVTIRHYDDATLDRVTTGKNVILEQKTRETARMVMSDI